MSVQNTPLGLCPFKTVCGFLEMSQTFRSRLTRARPCVGMFAVTNPVDFCHGVPQQQKSVLVKETALLRIKAAILGIFHDHKVQRFPKMKIAPAAKHARAKFSTRLSKRFAMWTVAWSAGRNSGRPVM